MVRPMSLTSGLVNRIIFTINKKNPTEVKEKTKIAKPKRNLNKPSICILFSY